MPRRCLQYVFLMLFCLLLFTDDLICDQKSDAQPEGWNLILISSFSYSMASFDNWTAGGENSQSAGTLNRFEANYESRRSKVEQRLRLQYNLTKLGEQEFRKSTDILKYDLGYKYKATRLIEPYLSLSAITQIYKSYDYFENPTTIKVNNGDGKVLADVFKFQVSRAFDPVKLEEGLGVNLSIIDKDKNKLNMFAGLGARQLITEKFYINDDDESTSDALEYKHVEDYSFFGFEGGYKLVLVVMKNIGLSSEFKGFYSTNDERAILTWDNLLSMQINEYFSVNIEGNMIIDDDISPAAQWKKSALLSFNMHLL